MPRSNDSNKRATLADVARVANVSVQTASHVLSGNTSVRLPETTRERVRTAARSVDYSPNRYAQAMKSGRANVLGVWMPVDRPTLVFLRFLQAISKTSRECGYDILITGLDASTAYGATEHVPTTWPVDGLIAVDAGKAVGLFRNDPKNDRTPAVVIGLEQYENSDSIAWDLLGATAEVVQELITQGRKRILHITPEWVLSNYPREQRRRGYTEVMESNGLTPELLGVISESSRSAEEAMKVYIQENGVPQAIFCFTDSLSVGAARAILDSGAKIPQDCAVWGVGDYPEAEDFRVSLSTIRIPIETVVEKSFEFLLKRIKTLHEVGVTAESNLFVTPMEIIHRSSGN